MKIRVPRSIDLFRRRPRSHFHPTPELFLQTGGGTDFECPGDRFRLRAGEVCLMPSGVPHAETPRDLRTRYGILVCMHERDGFFLHRATAAPSGDIVGGAPEHHAGPRGRDAFRYLEEAAAVGVPDRYRRWLRESLLEAFLITLLAELSEPAEARSSRSRLVAETENLAQSNLSDPEMSVARLARALGCSPDHLTRRFRAERGMALAQWISGERVKMARDLLGDARLNVAEVGWACGFNAPSYFIRVFREHTGLTPRAYRQTVSARAPGEQF